MKRAGSAPGKIILSGEYAVALGYRGIAMPAQMTATVEWKESDQPLAAASEGIAGSKTFLDWLVQLVAAKRANPPLGTLILRNTIPVGKGMGSSTAATIAMCRCLLGPDCEEEALEIEKLVTP